MTKDEAPARSALKLALEALEKLTDTADGFNVSGVYFNEQRWEKKCLDDAYDAITYIRSALMSVPDDEQPAIKQDLTPEQPAQPQEPVAVWELFEDGWDSIADPEWMETLPVGTKLYTSPPAQRKPLTDEQIVKCWGQVSGTRYGYVAFARAIERAHGIKGGK